jgi:phosphate butyryltransferase
MEQLVSTAMSLPTKTLVVACADDSHVLEAVEMARSKDIIKGILVGDKKAIVETLDSLQISPDNYQLIDESDPVIACQKAVRLVHDNKDYFLMKGLVATSTILRAALDKEFGLRTQNRISHVTVMQVATHPKLLFMTDGAMNITPSLDEKRQIIENSVAVAHAIGIENPYVGVIGAVETVNPQMEATVHAEQLVEMNNNGTITNCVVGGPFALDNAINKEAAHHKGITNPIAGEVDILVMPRIEAGNVFYKAMMFLAQAKSASIIAGAQRPIVLTSRADTTETKFHSIALGALAVNL